VAARLFKDWVFDEITTGNGGFWWIWMLKPSRGPTVSRLPHDQKSRVLAAHDFHHFLWSFFAQILPPLRQQWQQPPKIEQYKVGPPWAPKDPKLVYKPHYRYIHHKHP
jgi:hypothetical protein